VNASAWGRLLRLSLAPSVVADVIAGHVAASGAWRPGEWGGLSVAALCLYHGGMALNDWADRAHDARTRPDRPIPSGAIPATTALGVALALLAAGAGIACFALPLGLRWIPALLVASIAAYDLGPRGAWSGPLLLGTCRGANLALGLAAAGPVQAWWLAPVGLYAGYVIALSRVGRHEDAAAASVELRVLRLPLAAAALCMLGLAAAPPWPFEPTRLWLARSAALALALVALWPLRALHARPVFERREVLACMGQLLRRLLVCTAILALARGTGAAFAAAAVVLCGYPLAFFLRRIFPPS
jgi:4-hydroxybenzoate polyprenyltransferase